MSTDTRLGQQTAYVSMIILPVGMLVLVATQGC